MTEFPEVLGVKDAACYLGFRNKHAREAPTVRHGPAFLQARWASRLSSLRSRRSPGPLPTPQNLRQ